LSIQLILLREAVNYILDHLLLALDIVLRLFDGVNLRNVPDLGGLIFDIHGHLLQNF
jgi:hypothetical protein